MLCKLSTLHRISGVQSHLYDKESPPAPTDIPVAVVFGEPEKRGLGGKRAESVEGLATVGWVAAKEAVRLGAGTGIETMAGLPMVSGLGCPENGNFD